MQSATWVRRTLTNLLLKTYLISKPGLPLDSYANREIFKTYLHDVGLLGTMSGLKSNIILEGNELFTSFKGALTENYVAQALKNLDHSALYYWASEGRAKVDFVCDDIGLPIPIEVKSGMSKRKKSLLVYQGKYQPRLSIITSPSKLAYHNGLLNLPLYALSELPRLTEYITSK